MRGGAVRKYSKTEIAILKKYYPKKGSRFCAEQILKNLGIERNVTALKQKAMRLGLKLENPSNNPSHFKKGHVPHNVGKRMSLDVYDKVSKTFFKAGRHPHNTREELAISKRWDNSGCFYWYIRMSIKDWQLLHRVIYGNYHNIKLTSNHVITFVDGNHDNISPDNLLLISRDENMNRNNPRLHYPKEVVDIIRLNNKLKRKINAKKQD
jgi:phosphotransferase system IIB component